MKKIIQILKNNPAYLAMLKGKGEIVVSHASDEAILIASAFFTCPKMMLVIKDSLYQAQLLYSCIVKDFFTTATCCDLSYPKLFTLFTTSSNL